MKIREIGIYQYQECFSDDKQNKLPTSMQLPTAAIQALLLRLLLGQIKIKRNTGKLIIPKLNFFLLPYESKHYTCKSINMFFTIPGNDIFDVSIETNKELITSYFNRNRKNKIIHQQMLSEISNYFVNQPKSPIAAFTHLYRCLEFMSYSFPMLYAAKANDYKGTFTNLKNFFSAQSVSGELGFFRNFLSILLDDEDEILKYAFEIKLDMNKESLCYLQKDFEKIYKDTYELEDDTLYIKFEDMINFFITTRNSFFHLLVGQGKEHFTSTNYDIDDYFEIINPHILNWLSMIIQKITLYEFTAYNG